MLLWRTNDLSARGTTSPVRHGRPEVLRTLPDILADIPHEPGEPVRLPCFTTSSTASQYFEVANAAGRVVVDASFLYESELLEAYTRLPGVDMVLSRVDREDHPDLFPELSPDQDGAILRLAETMSLVLRTPGGGRIRTEARRFEPASIAAVIRSDALTRAQQKAEEVRLDPDVSDDLREMADALAAMSAQQSRRLTINAGNPLIQRLGRQKLTDPQVQKLMMGIYNNAILANRELITSGDAAIFHHQFQELIDRSLDYLDAQGELETARSRAREEDTRRRAASGAQPKHRIFFMITPFADRYRPLIAACRKGGEERWGAQLIIASDQQDDPRLLENLELLMRQAHAFIAEVTEGNPNVMFELGAAFTERYSRPFALLRERGASPALPADLRGMLWVDYEMEDPGLDEHLSQSLRKNSHIRALLDGGSPARFMAPGQLRALLPFSLDQTVIERLAARFPTADDWTEAQPADVAEILGPNDQDLAIPLLDRIRRRHP